MQYRKALKIQLSPGRLFSKARYESLLIEIKNLVNYSGNVVDVDTSITWKQQIKFAQKFLYLTPPFFLYLTPTTIWAHRQTTKNFDLGQLWTCFMKPIKDLIPTWSSLSSREIYKRPVNRWSHQQDQKLCDKVLTRVILEFYTKQPGSSPTYYWQKLTAWGISSLWIEHVISIEHVIGRLFVSVNWLVTISNKQTNKIGNFRTVLAFLW